MRKIVSEFRNAEWLRARYIDEKMTAPQLAALAGVSTPTIHNWMRELGVPMRNVSQAQKNYWAGKVHPWVGRKLPEEIRTKMMANRPDVRGKNNPMWGRVGMFCPGFRRVKSDTERAKLSAANKGRKRPELSGSKCPSWRGGKTPLVVLVRNSQRSIEWRDAVYARDKYTCRDCGDAQGGNLNAHHEPRLVDMLRQFRIRTYGAAMECAALWDLDNGTTLCKPCHAKRHKPVTKKKRLKSAKYTIPKAPDIERIDRELVEIVSEGIR
jgi:5-methylcytosine-specific restriction endonuclease McrA